jgi:hypothetical protein
MKTFLLKCSFLILFTGSIFQEAYSGGVECNVIVQDQWPYPIKQSGIFMHLLSQKVLLI